MPSEMAALKPFADLVAALTGGHDRLGFPALEPCRGGCAPAIAARNELIVAPSHCGVVRPFEGVGMAWWPELAAAS